MIKFLLALVSVLLCACPAPPPAPTTPAPAVDAGTAVVMPSVTIDAPAKLPANAPVTLQP